MSTPRRPRAPRRAVLVAAVVAGLLLCGCGAARPAPIVDGSYRFLASSSGARPSGFTAVWVAGDTLVLTTSSGTTSTSLGEETDEAPLCPGGGAGRPVRLDGGFSIAGLVLTTPALHGDCGETTPRRITFVDLDSRSEGLPPFTRWVEFCLGSDPDCPPADLAGSQRSG